MYVREGDDFGAFEAEGADSKLEDLVGLGCELGLEVGDLRSVYGEDATPRVAAGGRGAVAGLAAGDCYEVRLVDVGSELHQCVGKV